MRNSKKGALSPKVNPSPTQAATTYALSRDHENLCLSCQPQHTIWYLKLPTAVKASMASSDLENTS